MVISHLSLDFSTDCETVISVLQDFVIKSPQWIASPSSGRFITQLEQFQSLTWPSPPQRLLFEIIVDHCIRAERTSAGAGMMTLRILLKLENPISAAHSFIPTDVEFADFMTAELPDFQSRELLFAALRIAGLNSKIWVEPSPNETVSIELQLGYAFPIDNLLKLPTSQTMVSVAVVDGIVENVAELHGLLNEHSESKVPLLVVASNFGPDLAVTAASNWARGTLRFMPVRVKESIESVNMLVDIAVACNTDPVSSNKGQLVSSLCSRKLAIVDEVILRNDQLIIINKVSRAGVKVHSDRLLLKHEESTPDVADIISKRLKCLSPSSVKLRLPHHTRYAGYEAILDHGLRLTTSVLKRGLIRNADRLCTTDSILTAQYYSSAVKKLFTQTSTIIVNE